MSIIMATDDFKRLAERIIDCSADLSARFQSVQGFAYGEDRLHLVIRDCWLRSNQVVWERRSTPETKRADHDELMRQIEIYRMALALKAVADQYPELNEAAHSIGHTDAMDRCSDQPFNDADYPDLPAGDEDPRRFNAGYRTLD